MYIRVIRARARSGQLPAFVRLWQSRFVPGLLQVTGFRHAWFAGDRDLNTIAVVTLWDDLPRANELGPMIVAFEEQASGLMAAPSVIEEYEVLAEATAAAT